VAVKVGAVTMSVTLTGTPEVAPLGVTVTVPMSVPVVLSPTVLIETLTDAGTTPLGVATSQEPLGEVDVLKLVPVVPLMLKFCVAGVVPPSV
jgi:hypothetical protein